VRRGEIWWASVADPAGSGPGFRRPLLILSANSFNESRINTVIAAVVTSNLRLAEAPGNVRLPTKGTGLSKASVVNVSQLITVDKSFLTERLGRLSPRLLSEVDEGLRLVLSPRTSGL
jgi:mRNA interferase MazF